MNASCKVSAFGEFSRKFTHRKSPTYIENVCNPLTNGEKVFHTTSLSSHLLEKIGFLLDKLLDKSPKNYALLEHSDTQPSSVIIALRFASRVRESLSGLVFVMLFKAISSQLGSIRKGFLCMARMSLFLDMHPNDTYFSTV